MAGGSEKCFTTKLRAQIYYYTIILSKLYVKITFMNIKKINPKKIVDFMIMAGKLKWLKRSGWLQLKMPEPESVAEHTFRVVILSRILAPYLGLNSEKLTAMAIFHDFAEGMFGDPINEFYINNKIVKGEDNFAKANKFMEKVFDDLQVPELYLYWKENILEDKPNATEYSKILYQIGVIANVWQAFEYELRGVSKETTKRFWASADYNVTNPFLKQILSTLKRLQKSYKV